MSVMGPVSEYELDFIALFRALVFEQGVTTQFYARQKYPLFGLGFVFGKIRKIHPSRILGNLFCRIRFNAKFGSYRSFSHSRAARENKMQPTKNKSLPPYRAAQGHGEFPAAHSSIQHLSAETPGECIMRTGIFFAHACLQASRLALCEIFPVHRITMSAPPSCFFMLRSCPLNILSVMPNAFAVSMYSLCRRSMPPIITAHIFNSLSLNSFF
jgi:hypothetical protein